MSIAPLKAMASVAVSNVDKLTVDGQLPVRLVNYTDVYYGDRIRPTPNLMAATATPSQVAAFRLASRDVIITKDSETADDIGIAAYVEESADDLVCGYHLALLRPHEGLTDGRFLYWALSSSFVRGQFGTSATGVTRYGLRVDSIASTAVPAPPLPQQRATADYLDTETARIDALIAKKRRMVELLDERRSRLNVDTIRGAREPGEREPSGSDWLGSIPLAWNTPSVGHRYNVTLGRMLNEERRSSGEHYPYLRNVNVRWEQFDLTDLATMDFPASERVIYRLRRGDLLVCEGGAGFARAAVWNQDSDEIFFQKSLHRVRSREEWPVEWLIPWLRVGKAIGGFEAQGNLATIPHLTAEQFRAWRLPFPPTPSDCQRLLADLHEQSQELDLVQGRLNTQITLLREHRQALITAAVTGELDLPEVAA